MDYKEIYENWETLPDCRMSLPDESFWGKELPDKTYGINNMVLSDVYRLHDIVRTRNLNEEDDGNLIVHRRWNTLICFGYDEPEGDESKEIRNKIYDALENIGQPGFMWSGLAYMMFEQEMPTMTAVGIIEDALSLIGIAIHPPR